MAENNSWKPEEDDEEEEVDETGYKAVKDAVLFAIEVSETMLTLPLSTGSKKDDKDSPTTAALKCAYALMQQRIISNPNDMIGVLLFGTELSKFQREEASRGNLGYPNCYLFIDLDVPAAEDVKSLKALVNDDDDDSKELLKPSKEVVSMANLLFCANQLFTTKAPNFSSRRLFIITDNDNPHATDKAMRASAAVRAKDLYDLGVTIELFPISKPDELFDRSKFYDDIIYNSTPSDPEAPVLISSAIASPAKRDGISLLQSLLSSINSKAVAKRSLFSNLRFEIGPGFVISVSGYILFKRQEPKRGHYVYLGGEKAQIVTGETTRTADDTARVVDKTEIKKAYKFGGEQILFTNEESSQLRQFGDPVIRIIGFKPSSMLPVWANVRPSTFIYPSEEDFVGSTRVFAALHQKLLDSHKVALAWYIARKNAGPQIVAIVPGAEIADESGNQTMPAGLWICPLPFADDIRHNPEQRLIRAPEPLIDLMREVIQQLQLPKAIYDPQRFPNPALQWHYRILQAMALEEDIPDQPDDKTIPKYKQIDKRAGSYITSWGRELESQHTHYVKNSSHPSSSLPVVGTKRPAPGSAASSSQVTSSTAKRAKVADSGLNDSAMKLLVDGGDVSKLKVSDLKPWLQTKGFDVSNKKKGELVAQVEGFFDKNR